MEKIINIGDFYTRGKANEGIKLPLSLPDGSETEHYIQVRGVDSDVFRDAEVAAKRNSLRIAALNSVEEQKAALKDDKTTLIASLVISWSFEQECTVDNVKKFLLDAPQISDAIDQTAGKRALFFKGK